MTDVHNINEVLISVIMPVFNAEKYLSRAIESVINQTYTNWELICVDDGSADESLSILKKYSDQDNRIFFHVQENSGPSIAREKAILNSNGKYVASLDADDFLDNDYLKDLYQVASKNNSDVTLADALIESAPDSSTYFSLNESNNISGNKKLTNLEAFEKTLPWSICSIGLFDAELVKKHSTGQNARINNYNADEYITRVLFLNASTIMTSTAKYYYTSNQDSITKSISLKKFCTIDTNREICELVKQHKLPKKYENIANYFAFTELISSQKLLYMQGSNSFTQVQVDDVQNRIKTAYLQIQNKFSALRARKKLASKFVPAISYFFFRASCYLGAVIKTYKNRHKSKK